MDILLTIIGVFSGFIIWLALGLMGSLAIEAEERSAILHLICVLLGPIAMLILLAWTPFIIIGEAFENVREELRRDESNKARRIRNE